MEKLEFKIRIEASREKIWDVLWGDSTYPQWTAPFSEGSRAEGDWSKGSKVSFLNADDEGMIATVVENIPNEQMSIRHIGMVNKGVVDYDSAATQAWSGAMEEYWLTTIADQSELTVKTDITEEYKDYFTQAWPKALEVVKTLAEQ